MKSYLGYSSNDNGVYANQYMEAFEFLFNNRNSLTGAGRLVDLPLLFLLRHSIEVILKYNIDYFKDYSGSQELVNDLNKTHDIRKLYNAFIIHLNASFTNAEQSIHEQINTMKGSLDKLIDNIEKLDKDSLSFRYAFDKKNNKTLNDGVTIDLIKDIWEPYKESKSLLAYSINVHQGF